MFKNRFLKNTDKIPELYSTESEKDPVVQVKLFCCSATWFLTEFDLKNSIGFGYADLFGDGSCGELGYISLEELLTLDVNGMKVERDQYFTPKSLSEAKRELYG